METGNITMVKRNCLLIFLLLSAGSGNAEVMSSAPEGFEVRFTAEVADVSAAQAYAQFLRVHEWWDANHSWFGTAEGFSIDPRAGGCFCEVSGDRSHLHMTVSHVDPGVEIRMIGGLGPLQDLALQGAMVWRFEALADGGTRVIHSYRVAGYLKDGLTGLASAVDSVQGIQFGRLVARLQL